MKLGLLQCDHVPGDLRGIAGDYSDMFARWLPGEWRVYDLPAGAAPGRADECDAWITTGSRASVYDDEPWIHAFADLTRAIHQSGVPYLGVCFGHQMMAHALGGRVGKSARGWGVGVHEFRVASGEPWMQPPLAAFGVLMSCQDQVEQLPAGAVVLAGDAHCPIGMFRVGALLGIQGHPEWTREYAEALLRRRRERIGAERVDAALATLAAPVHARELAEWALRWLARGAAPVR